MLMTNTRGPQLLEILYSFFEIFIKILNLLKSEILKDSVYCPFIHRKVAAKRSTLSHNFVWLLIANSLL